jgi:spore coat protein A
MHDHPDMPSSRRRFLRFSAGAAATAATAAVLPLVPGVARAAVQGTNTRWAMTSDPALWQQAWARRFTNVLPNPLAAASIYKPTVGATDYTIGAGQATADVLGVPGIATTIWGYANQETGPTFPGRTLQVSKGVPITVHWVNRLVNASGQALPHILPIDQTMTLQTPTTGVPLAVHHHGSNSAAEFDGGPDQWATPLRRQTGPGITGNAVQVGTAEAVTYVYDNNQEASLHWYHDHAESLTGVNVQAGLAGLYVVRDANEKALQSIRRLPAAQHEVALVLQDRTFDAQGQFVYASNPANFAPLNLPLSGAFPPGSPSHMPEVFGDVILVNGKAWPSLSVEPRPYRLRLLNASDSRFFTLRNSAPSWVPMSVIGTDVGLLNTPVPVGAAGLTIAPGERYDVVIDFSWAWLLGGQIDLLNSAPTPFPAGGPPSAGAATVMRFKVGLLANLLVPRAVMGSTTALRGSNGTALLPAALGDTAATPVRRILLGEGSDEYGRINPMLGVYDPTGASNLGTQGFNDPVTETPRLGSTEVWEFWNTTLDAHPVHLHLVKFRIKNRQAFDPANTQPTAMRNGWTGVKLLPGAPLLGAAVAPAATESGWKDTVICPPGQVTRIVMTFDRPGKFVYHCHILSHEDHDMMRWFLVA